MFFYELLRYFGLITGYPVQCLIFKHKICYENKRAQSRRVRGGALIISNHFSVLDYVSNVFVLAFRKLYVVHAATKSRFAAFGMKFFGGIPVDRSSYHMTFMDTSVELLQRGELVQIFPEAHITPNGKMQPFKTSYLHIALRAGVPIIPVIMDGRYGIFKRTHVIIGEGIDPAAYCRDPSHPTREEIAALNDMIQAKCHALYDDMEARRSASRRPRNSRKESTP